MDMHWAASARATQGQSPGGATKGCPLLRLGRLSSRLVQTVSSVHHAQIAKQLSLSRHCVVRALAALWVDLS